MVEIGELAPTFLERLSYNALPENRKQETLDACIRRRLGPTKKRLKDRIEKTWTLLQQNVTLDESENKANKLLLKLEGNLKSYQDLLEQLREASKEDEAKSQRLEDAMEEFSIVALDGDQAICALKTLLIDIAKRKKETTEKEENQKERVHERELQMEKLQQEKGLHLAKLNQEKQIQMDKLKLKFEAKRKLAQTEMKMEIKRTTADIELKMKQKWNKNVLNWKKSLVFQLLVTLPLSSFPNWNFKNSMKIFWRGKNFWVSFKASIHKNPNLPSVDKFNH